MHGTLSSESHLHGVTQQTEQPRLSVEILTNTGVNRRKDEAAFLPDMRGGIWTLSFQLGGGVITIKSIMLTGL